MQRVAQYEIVPKMKMTQKDIEPVVSLGISNLCY